MNPGYNILVTAGPTREPIDPVRYISNRSSGRMGYAIARAAARHGHRVILISGPVSIKPPSGVILVRITTAAEMLAAVKHHLVWCRVLIMAAAVSDWHLKQTAAQKIKKHPGKLNLTLHPTVDILSAVSLEKGDRLHIGFAAETQNLLDAARRKLREKRLDYIFANDVSRADIGFDVDDNQVTVIAADGGVEQWPRMPKQRLATRLIKLVEHKLASEQSGDGKESRHIMPLPQE